MRQFCEHYRSFPLALAMVVVFGLAGCTAVYTQSSQRLANYGGSITSLLIVWAPNVLRSRNPADMAVIETDLNSRRYFSFGDAIEARFPQAFAAQKVDAVVAKAGMTLASALQTREAIAGRVVLYINPERATSFGGNTNFYLNATLHDPGTKNTIWKGEFLMGAGAGGGRLNNETADQLASSLISSLHESGLLARN